MRLDYLLRNNLKIMSGHAEDGVLAIAEGILLCLNRAFRNLFQYIDFFSLFVHAWKYWQSRWPGPATWHRTMVPLIFIIIYGITVISAHCSRIVMKSVWKLCAHWGTRTWNILCEMHSRQALVNTHSPPLAHELPCRWWWTIECCECVFWHLLCSLSPMGLGENHWNECNNLFKLENQGDLCHILCHLTFEFR